SVAEGTVQTAFTSGVSYGYNASEQVTSQKTYGWGSGGSLGALLQDQEITYEPFGTTNIVDRPAYKITYDGSGTRVAETDYTYDQGSLSPTSVFQHDSAPGGSTRGNLTTLSSKCFNGSCPADSTTTYAYYDT